MEKTNERLIEEDIREFGEVLKDLKMLQLKQASLIWNFWRGVFYGFGFFVGSAIIVSMLAYILNHIGVDGNSYLGRMINKIIEIFQQSR